MKFLSVRQFRLSIPGDEAPPSPRNPSDAASSQGLTEATANRRSCDSMLCGTTKTVSMATQIAVRTSTWNTVSQLSGLCQYCDVRWLACLAAIGSMAAQEIKTIEVAGS